MAKILCSCGELIYDQTDFISNKAHLIADQDYFDFFDEVENKDYNSTGNVSRYFSDVFQCNNCKNLILFINDQRFDFCPLDNINNTNILSSYLGNKWPGTMSANFREGRGEVFWNTNSDSGFRANLTLNETREFYNQKFQELTTSTILRHSFLYINGNMEHRFDYKE